MDNQKNTQKNRISELIESSLDSIRELVDANTIIGEAIMTSAGTTIIPISKVSAGYHLENQGGVWLEKEEKGRDGIGSRGDFGF